jgi:hypothetical protein
LGALMLYESSCFRWHVLNYKLALIRICCWCRCHFCRCWQVPWMPWWMERDYLKACYDGENRKK